MLSPHSTLDQTELKGRGGWGTLELKPSMLFSGLQMGSRCPARSPCGCLAKETHSSPSCWGCAANNSQRAVGEVPHHLGCPLPEEAARLGEGQGEGTPSTLYESWHARGMDGSEPPDPCAINDTKKSSLAAWHGLLSSNGNDNQGWVVATWVLDTCFPGIDNPLATL